MVSRWGSNREGQIRGSGYCWFWLRIPCHSGTHTKIRMGTWRGPIICIFPHSHVELWVSLVYIMIFSISIIRYFNSPSQRATAAHALKHDWLKEVDAGCAMNSNSIWSGQNFTTNSCTMSWMNEEITFVRISPFYVFFFKYTVFPKNIL